MFANVEFMACFHPGRAHDQSMKNTTFPIFALILCLTMVPVRSATILDDTKGGTVSLASSGVPLRGSIDGTRMGPMVLFQVLDTDLQLSRMTLGLGTGFAGGGSYGLKFFLYAVDSNNNPVGAALATEFIVGTLSEANYLDFPLGTNDANMIPYTGEWILQHGHKYGLVVYSDDPTPQWMATSPAGIPVSTPYVTYIGYRYPDYMNGNGKWIDSAFCGAIRLTATPLTATLGVSIGLELSGEAIKPVPIITLKGQVGLTYRVDYVNAISETWKALAMVTLWDSPKLFVDVSAIGQPIRFYRIVKMP